MICVTLRSSVAHLYQKQEEPVYDHVFVRIDCHFTARSTAARRSCSGAAEATGAAVSSPDRNCEPIAGANARSIAYTARSTFDTDIQRTQTAVDWSRVHFWTRHRICGRSDERFALLRCSRVGRRVEDS
jgi:hypothetical protein